MSRPVDVLAAMDELAEGTTLMTRAQCGRLREARAAVAELIGLLDSVTYHMEGGVRMEYPASPEESPQPASEWDHEANRLAGEARRLLSRVQGAV